VFTVAIAIGLLCAAFLFLFNASSYGWILNGLTLGAAVAVIVVLIWSYNSDDLL
jgi:hypothetical protein